MEFNGIYLKEDSVSLFQKSVVNLYVFYQLDTWLRHSNTDLTLDNCLFGSVKLGNNVDPDKYGYSGYGTGFNRVHNLHSQTVAGVKMLLFLGLS